MQFRFLIAATLLAATVTAAAQSTPARPKITGISHLALYTSDPAATDRYYREVIGAARLPDPENPKGVRYALSPTQFVEVLPLPANAGINRLDHSAYNTEDVDGLRIFLAAKGWKTPAAISKGEDGSRWFTVLDPEGNKVQFIQPPRQLKPIDAPNAIGRHIIHIGILTHSRAAEDTFYRDLLGFTPLWWGGKKEGVVDWVSQQMPDSRDWLEYMLEETHDLPAATGIPADMKQHTLGVLDHFSIGEKSVDAAYEVLKAGNRLVGECDKHTQMGLDGRGQFNMYDPDGIRIELMNFHATQKPCCSPFTGEDPGE